MFRRQRLWLLALIVAIATVALFTLTTSQPKVISQSESIVSASMATKNSPQPEKPESSKNKSISEQLNFTIEQKQQIARIRQRYHKQISDRQEKLESLQQQLGQMMAGTEPAALVRLKNQELIALRREIEELRFESMLAAREILTLPQRQKFMKIIKARRQQL